MFDTSEEFRTLFSLKEPAQQVDIDWCEKPIKLPDVMQQNVDQYWRTLDKAHIFNGTLVRLDHWQCLQDHPKLFLRPSDYKTLLYSNRYTRAICDTWGPVHLSRILGISAVLISEDEKLIYMKRSPFVGEYPGHLDVFGGHIDVQKEKEPPDVYRAMAQELEEEVNLQPEEYSLTLLGLIEVNDNLKPELIFQARARLSCKEICERTLNSKDRKEFSQVLCIDNFYSAIEKVLLRDRKLFSPSAFGCLCLYINRF